MGRILYPISMKIYDRGVQIIKNFVHIVTILNELNDNDDEGVR